MKTHHRVIFGDSRHMDTVGDSSVHLVVTSPPYWHLKDYGEGVEIGQESTTFEDYMGSLCVVLDECVRKLVPDGKLVINVMPTLLPGGSSTFSRRVTKTVLTELEDHMDSLGNMYLMSLHIWDKRKAVRFSSWGSYPYPTNMLSSYPYEWIIVFSKSGRRDSVDPSLKEASRITHREFTDWVQNSIWDFQPASASREGHPAPFPEELPKRCIKLYSFVSDIVLDPFAGTGTTLGVARRLGRSSIGYEVNPDYEKLIRAKLGVGEDWDDQATFEFTTQVARSK
ncbi:MAG: site-specific DNA-methyltransferase [Candidatus Thorarchaeota archaeon]|nr:MAG: site-specific DNA-methyltransferase [Candidatus Thorarchaeota archaeon]